MSDRPTPAPPTILGTTTPRGLALETGERGKLLVDVGDEDRRRVLGWYYGYPACCVEAFIVGDRTGERTHHPVSWHVLCDACTAGPPAPLPPRIAAYYWFAHPPVDDDDWRFEAPSGYDGYEQLTLDGATAPS